MANSLLGGTGGLTKLGNTNVSSLLKSAQAAQNSLNTYNDDLEANNFRQDPSGYYQTYIKYLNGRMSSEAGLGTTSGNIKVLDLQNRATSAFKSYTTANLDNISTQYIVSGASDQAKLDYLTSHVLNDPGVQADRALWNRYAMQANTLQQSIEYHAQAAQTAATTQAASDLAAQEKGYTDGLDHLKALWNMVRDANATGDTKALTQAEQDQAKTVAPLFKENGISMPKGATGDIHTIELSNLVAQALYSAGKSVAAGPDTADGIKYADEAAGVLQSPHFKNVLVAALTPEANFSTETVGNTNSTTTHPVIGYTHMLVHIPGVPGTTTVNVPQANPSDVNPWAALGKTNQSNVDNKLKAMGFDILGKKGGYQMVQISDKAMQWIGKKTGLSHNDQIQVIPTTKGFQFTGKDGNLYGVSFDKTGKGGLYMAGNNDTTWSLVGGEYGFNAGDTSSLANAIGRKQEIRNVGQDIHTVIAQKVGAFSKFISPVTNWLSARIPQSHQATMEQRAGGGFNFTNAQGRPISAATYAEITRQSFWGLLNNMSQRGDAGARQMMTFTGNDMQYDPRKIGQGSNAADYNAFTWGAEPAARVNGPTYAAGGGIKLPSGFTLGK